MPLSDVLTTPVCKFSVTIPVFRMCEARDFKSGAFG